MCDATLFQNGGHVGLGDVIDKRTVAENHLSIASRVQFLVPGDDALS